MNELYLGVALFLLINLCAGLMRILRGPTRFDCMLAAMLCGTKGVAIVLLLSASFCEPAFLDMALIFALLASIATVAFTRSVSNPKPKEGGLHEH